MMIGSEPPELEHRTANTGDTVLRVQGLSLRSQDPFGVDLQSIALQVRAGEVVGIAGVSGNGQKELMYALSGEDTREAEAVQLLGKGVGRMGPSRRRGMGLHFVPEERLGRGAVPSMGLAHNLLLTRKTAWARAAGFAWRRCRRRRGTSSAASTSRPAARTRPRSRCRAAICRSSSWVVKLMPSRVCSSSLSPPGGGCGAAAQIRGEILKLRDQGCAVLVVSEELDELFEICDRLHVVAKGRLSPSVDRAAATVQQIGEWMSGLWDAAAVQGGAHA
jgi:simple sugar transport system ATP-binding protein